MPNGFNMYDIDERVVDYLNIHLKSKNKEEITKNIARKKFSCIINYAYRRKHDDETNVTKYYYGRYEIVVDESAKKIFYINIEEDENKVKLRKQKTPVQIHKTIKEAYIKLGLSHSGYRYRQSEYSLI